MMTTEHLEGFIKNGYHIPTVTPEPPHNIDNAGVNTTPAIITIDAVSLAEKAFNSLVEPVENLIAEGATLLCGPAKGGKSYLSLQMGASVASGIPFLGRKTSPGAVLYMALEDSERRIKDRMQQQGIAPCNNLHFCTTAITLNDGLITFLSGWLTSNPSARMIIVDTLQMIRGQVPRGSSVYAEDYKVVGQLKALADQYHVAIVVIHHINKTQSVIDPFDRISGSTGLMAAADTTILLDRKRGEEDATIIYTGRDVFGENFQIRFENCRWKVCDPAMLAREQYENSPAVKAIKLFISQGSFDGTWRITYDDFKQYAADNGFFIGSNQGNAHKALEAVTQNLEQYDGIIIEHDKRINKARGFRISKKGGCVD